MERKHDESIIDSSATNDNNISKTSSYLSLLACKFILGINPNN